MPHQLTTQCCNHTITLTLHPSPLSLELRAVCNLSGRLYQTSLESPSLPQGYVDYGCQGVYSLLEESLDQGRPVTFNDSKLSFQVKLSLGKKQVQKELVFYLPEEVGEVKKLRLKVKGLELELEKVKAEVLGMREEIKEEVEKKKKNQQEGKKEEAVAVVVGEQKKAGGLLQGDTRVKFEIDKNTILFPNFTVVGDNTISLLPDPTPHTYPLFHTQKLSNPYTQFLFQIIQNYAGWAIGICLLQQNSLQVDYDKSNCVCLDTNSIHVNKRVFKHGKDLTASKMQILMSVDLERSRVTWSRDFVVCAEADIPWEIRGKELGVVVQLVTGRRDVVRVL